MTTLLVDRKGPGGNLGRRPCSGLLFMYSLAHVLAMCVYSMIFTVIASEGGGGGFFATFNRNEASKIRGNLENRRMV